jgi:hypothetical protein
MHCEGARGSVVIKALCYKLESRGFDEGDFFKFTDVLWVQSKRIFAGVRVCDNYGHGM